MLRAALLALVILTSRPEPAPSTIRAAASRAKPSVGLLLCRGTVASAVIVGGSGQVLTSARACDSGEVHLALSDGRTPLLTRVRSDAQLDIQLLKLPPGEYPAAPAARHAAFTGDWIIAVTGSKRGLHAALGMLGGPDPGNGAWVLIDAPAQLGAGVFSLEGKLVGIAVAAAPRHRMRVVPIDTIRAWLAGVPGVATARGGAR
jgi:S1-C subfamily serine protease